MLHAIGDQGLSRGGSFCASPPRFKNFGNSAVGFWKSWVQSNPGRQAVLDKRLFGTEGSGRVGSDNPADKLEPAAERDAVAEDPRTC